MLTNMLWSGQQTVELHDDKHYLKLGHLFSVLHRKASIRRRPAYSVCQSKFAKHADSLLFAEKAVTHISSPSGAPCKFD